MIKIVEHYIKNKEHLLKYKKKIKSFNQLNKNKKLCKIRKDYYNNKIYFSKSIYVPILTLIHIQ
jgi:hypothetical protein